MPQRQAERDLAGQLEVARATAVRAEIGSLAKSDFLARLSHDLRTPMNSVMGMLRLLLDSGLAPHQRDYAMAAAKAAERLLDLVRQISAFPLHDARSLRLENHPFAVAEVCRAVVKLLSGRAAEKSLTLRCELAAQVPALVLGDAEKLAQVLANLVDNAIRFTDHGAVRLEVRSGSSSGVLEFIVADTGRGIASDKLAVLFDFSAPVIAASRYADVSLELAVCREIIQAMGGELACVSSPGHGTTFTISVPLPPATALEAAVEPAMATPALPAFAPVCEGLRLLLAEDDPINQSLAVAFIEKLGGQVEVAADGLAAVAKCREQRYDLVFMDCDMPGMDGFDAARAIRELEAAAGAERRRMPIIAMTAYAMPGDRERCLAAGMDDHVPKPVTIEVLQQVVRRHVLPEQVHPGA